MPTGHTIRTVAERLGEVGGRCAHIGKWHLCATDYFDTAVSPLDVTLTLLAHFNVLGPAWLTGADLIAVGAGDAARSCSSSVGSGRYGEGRAGSRPIRAIVTAPTEMPQGKETT
jgi:hypothetical protein